MLTDESSLPHARSAFWLVLLLLPFTSCLSQAQVQPPAEDASYARKNTFSAFAAYSNDSSHIFLGLAEQRKLLDFGVSYERRLLINHVVNWQYSGEFLPVALESDPLAKVVNQETVPVVATYIFTGDSPPVVCSPTTIPYTFYGSDGTVVLSGTNTTTCSGRRWTIGEAISPVGFQWNFLTRRKMQPFLIGHGGYMYSTKPIPTFDDGSFNFTFDFGAGIELYRSNLRSIRAEYRYHHISNHYTSLENPGIDNGLFQISYAFGK